MTELSDLYALRDMLDKAEGPSREIDVKIARVVDGWSESDVVGFFDLMQVHRPLPKYTFSIDAAEALRQRLLPDSFIQVKQDAKDAYVVILTGFFGRYGGLNRCAPTEPLAILKALVAALIATKEQPQ